MLDLPSAANSRFFKHDCGVNINCRPHVLQADLFLKIYSSIWLSENFLGYNSTVWVKLAHFIKSIPATIRGYLSYVRKLHAVAPVICYNFKCITYSNILKRYISALLNEIYYVILNFFLAAGIIECAMHKILMITLLRYVVLLLYIPERCIWHIKFK
jgi:hypothetical protein